ncbi:MAG TPA: CRISPR-associated protein Cas4 [Methanoregula sp.]|mgnify:CR=1 FL=1|nr:CRISPR-associated protein Cas4 [Methanoregula sp.]
MACPSHTKHIILGADALLVDISSQGLFTGTQVNYYVICPTKLWLFTHRITMESGSDLVAMGRFIHETSYEREKKDVIIDNKVGIDFIKSGDTITVHEVKKSKKMERAHRYQLLYYIYYLATVKGLPKVDGILDYPESRERVHVELTSASRVELEGILSAIPEIICLESPPPPEKKTYCRKCAYMEFCWV